MQSFRILIVPYYSVIGGWVLKYLVEYVRGHAQTVAEDGYFSAFISDGFSTEICFAIFSVIHIGDYLCGCAQWNRACLQIHDADTCCVV